MSKMLERIKAAQKKISENSSSSSSGEKEEIFFNLDEGIYRIRLVGDGWTTIHSHWIGNTTYTLVKLFPDSAFTGENRIKKIVCCADFDPETETTKSKKSCILCKLRKEANDMLYDDSIDLSKEQKELLVNISKESRANERYFFLCIDRDNPEIAPGKNGLKIIEFPIALFKQFLSLAEKNSDIDLFSDDEGVDLIIEKKRDGKKWSYTLNFAMDGRSVATTPLTEKEKAYQKHDIKKIMGKLPSQRDLYEHLLPEYQDMIELDLDEEEEEMEEEKPQEEKPKQEEKKPKVSVPKRKPHVEEVEEDEEEDMDDVPF